MLCMHHVDSYSSSLCLYLRVAALDIPLIILPYTSTEISSKDISSCLGKPRVTVKYPFPSLPSNGPLMNLMVVPV